MVKKIGMTLFFLGLISGAMHLLGYQHKILSWVGHWGEETAWGLRGAMVFVGGGLMFLENIMGDDGLEGDIN